MHIDQQKKSIIAKRIPTIKIKYLMDFAIFLLLALANQFNNKYNTTKITIKVINKFI